jgi:hypothetical protein
MDVTTALLVLAASIAAVLLSEAISWIIVYRTDSFRRLQAELDRSSRKLEALKGNGTSAGSSSGGGAKPASRDKKVSKNRLDVVTQLHHAPFNGATPREPW